MAGGGWAAYVLWSHLRCQVSTAMHMPKASPGGWGKAELHGRDVFSADFTPVPHLSGRTQASTMNYLNWILIYPELTSEATICKGKNKHLKKVINKEKIILLCQPASYLLFCTKLGALTQIHLESWAGAALPEVKTQLC